jgi:hypothetical protein
MKTTQPLKTIEPTTELLNKLTRVCRHESRKLNGTIYVDLSTGDLYFADIYADMHCNLDFYKPYESVLPCWFKITFDKKLEDNLIHIV